MAALLKKPTKKIWTAKKNNILPPPPKKIRPRDKKKCLTPSKKCFLRAKQIDPPLSFFSLYGNGTGDTIYIRILK